MKVLVTGGARSGKSSFAERLCRKRASSAYYIATSQAFDEEMKERIALHRQQREASGYAWQTIEEPVELAAVLDRLGQEYRSHGDMGLPAPTVLVDCLTLWLSNLLLIHEQDGQEGIQAVRAAAAVLEAAVSRYPGSLVLVTNEVGDSIVPEYRLGRVFRDLAGFLNQRMASISDEVFLVTAGIPVELKRLEYRL
ncbi:bifunctional adenosylcobinamide kinase/adenosylcobinamide-phosphate guanylyltransferase [Paenibacillus sp. JX-17]|uniref:Adenosylcobinamide kinase n=1 Tax=Paenibacillus lacisoli TaxID=3064525 RepID=A0ABT9CDM9_9BACL|nr:bifunctional adenosylcobinamide kinase/adenosylcobinamide-phosphate guanylyltransferase [Paenibacillus sp. JX-17]MDO7907336.1 bifunctional adenosylcobinamide kinase/adenosylcobinamide-phosphate guanylyltransferase [Paenibacillus sp. JX-17]